MQQTVNGNTTTYALDLNVGLTQVLNDGTNQYLYGVGRISQVNTDTDYFMTDALGSLRQLTDAQGQVTLANAYEPYGVLTHNAGSAQTSYGFTGEFTDPSGMVYLRARYYMPGDGRFLTRDTWMGDYNSPLSLNRWLYVEGNPVNYTDPSGHIREDVTEAQEALDIVRELQRYQVKIVVDWGYIEQNSGALIGVLPLQPEALQLYLSLYESNCGKWNEGDWTIGELREFRKGTIDLARAMGYNNFIFNLGFVNVVKADIGGDIARGLQHLVKVSNAKDRTMITRWSTVHELGHSWDANYGWKLSKMLVALTRQYGKVHAPVDCSTDPFNKKPGCNKAHYVYYDVLAFGSDERMNAREDFANAVAAYVYPDDSQGRIQKYQYPSKRYSYIDYSQYLYYTDYRTTLRWRIIDSLIHSTNNVRPR